MQFLFENIEFVRFSDIYLGLGRQSSMGTEAQRFFRTGLHDSLGTSHKIYRPLLLKWLRWMSGFCQGTLNLVSYCISTSLALFSLVVNTKSAGFSFNCLCHEISAPIFFSSNNPVLPSPYLEAKVSTSAASNSPRYFLTSLRNYPWCQLHALYDIEFLKHFNQLSGRTLVRDTSTCRG
jgi:hypothetical protein